ncbi:hypothetical protein IEO21_09222 [Rhodonia placenta]|uniref:Uncharacterized protein n=1 Tax=Rhodonia placenta TaxID=104341 RepID=A0A8H7NUV2_9APHY|nr:hypothetical protein IEO21_09222 [Postia placenta]
MPRGGYIKDLHGGYAGGAYTGGSLPQDRIITDGLAGRPIKTLCKPEPESAGADVVLKDLTYLGSYNWTNSKKPTIIVPGSPSIWHDRSLPFTAPPDRGFRFIDQSGYRMPSCMLYPLFRAVDIVAEENETDIDWLDVDFVTDRNGLRKLLRWIHADRKEFRIDTQLVGRRTVLLSRWEKRTQDFGGLIMVVRFEVDACLPTECDTSSTAPSSDVDGLTDMFSGMDVGEASTTELDVISAGQQIPQDAIIEMSTRWKAGAGRFNWKESYPQLYLSQTPHHYLAMHDSGEFYEITKRRLDCAEMKEVDGKTQTKFRQLRQILGTIQELLIEHGQSTSLSLVYKNGELLVFKRSMQESLIPDELFTRFNQ